MADLRDSASLVAVHGHDRAALAVARGLRALAHRGGTSAGIVAIGDVARARREPRDAFLADEAALEALVGTVAIGERHARESDDEARHGLVDGLRLPRTARLGDTTVALAVSGSLLGTSRLARESLQAGALLDGDDPEALLLPWLARSHQRTLVNRLVDALWKVEGGFAIVLAAPGLLIGVRDRRGLRPLVLGQAGGVTVLASEESAVLAAGAAPIRALAPGEMVIADAQGVASVKPFAGREAAPCAQEWLALAHAANRVDDTPVWSVRERLGEALGRGAVVPVPAALGAVVVAATPDAVPVAVGLGRSASLPVVPALVGSGVGVRAIGELVARRPVVLAALTASAALRPAVEALLGAGAVEVDVRIASPRVVRPCLYGVEGLAPEPEDDALPLDTSSGSVVRLSVPRLREALRGAAGSPCAGCLGEPWPVPPVDDVDEQLPLFGKDAQGEP